MTKRRKFYTAFLQGLETRAGRRWCFQPTSKKQGQVRHIAHSVPPVGLPPFSLKGEQQVGDQDKNAKWVGRAEARAAMPALGGSRPRVQILVRAEGEHF